MALISPNFRLASEKFYQFNRAIIALSLICVVAFFQTSCSTGMGATNTTPSNPSGTGPTVSVTPAIVTLAPSARQQFTAAVEGSSKTAVIWSASSGSITNTGVYTAPATPTASVVVTATSVATPTNSGRSQVTVKILPLTIQTSSLSGAAVNTAYDATLSASGGTPPYTWTIAGGSLPTGIQLQGSGVVAGTTSQSGEYSFMAKVTDVASNSAVQTIGLAVTAAEGCGNYDGPAELPCVYLQTTLADTPAPGRTITVPAGGNLQSALNNANCGDTVAMQAGATFSAGQYTFPAKQCDDQHWIIVRTTTPDTSLPPEGTRMTPCYAGVTSLPGRPVFPCSAPQKLLATITYSGTGDGPIAFASGANHYRLLGLEVTRAAKNGQCVTGLITSEGAPVSQIVLDRLYIHGTPKDETRRGVDLSGATSMAVQDSYISDFHCNINGDCVDSQAVAGGGGNQIMGPWKIDDNFLDAAGENILFGGSAATQTPADIEIRFNHFFKPMFWMQGQPGFTGPAFVVKNHIELKNAQRVLIDSNILEDDWGGFTQHGISVLLNPSNQDINGVSVCPLCQVTNVTIRYATISHVAGAFQIDTGHTVIGGVPLAGNSFSIHDVIADDIDGTQYVGDGKFVQMGSVAKPLLHNVEINHITAFPVNVMFNLGAPSPVQIPGFVFTNSIITAGNSALTSTGQYGQGNCAYAYRALNILNRCFAGYTFNHNALLETPYPSSFWPAGNSFYSISDIGFVNYNGGNGGDYNLQPSSPAIGAASDGTNLGANVPVVLSAISGVQ